MKIKAVIFDLDGTLVNTICDLCNAVNYALKKLKMEEITTEECLGFVGNGISSLMVKSFKDEDGDLDKALMYFNEYYKENCIAETIPYLDIINILMNLKERGIKIGVASNKKHEYVDLIVRCYFDGLVDAYQGEIPSLARKPEGDIVYSVVNRLGVSLDDIAYIGDSEVDVDTVRKIGCKGAFVSYGFRSYDTLENYGAKPIAKNPRELLGVLETLWVLN